MALGGAARRTGRLGSAELDLVLLDLGEGPAHGLHGVRLGHPGRGVGRVGGRRLEQIVHATDKVLHHVVKYGGTGSELHRVLRKGGKALFSEGAAGNPLIRWARRFTIREEVGDVPLTTRRVKQWARDFSYVEWKGHFFLYMLKRFGFTYEGTSGDIPVRNRFGKWSGFNGFLRCCLTLDELLLNQKPLGKYLGGRYLIELAK